MKTKIEAAGDRVGRWAEKLGMKPDTLSCRIKIGWSIADAIERKVANGTA